jgi:hypothetical protein
MEQYDEAIKKQQTRHVEKVDQTAQAAGTTREKAAHELTADEQWRLSRQQQRETQKQQARGSDFYNETNDDTRLRQDGYQETEGSGYGASDNKIGQPAQENPAQQGYDPAQSGPRPSKRQPGAKIPTPGRETGTAWGENEHMGYTTDTPDQGNPAN